VDVFVNTFSRFLVQIQLGPVAEFRKKPLERLLSTLSGFGAKLNWAAVFQGRSQGRKKLEGGNPFVKNNFYIKKIASFRFSSK
jgi:hypothetical protein